MSSVWFPYYRPQPDARLRLVCFPFAGGGAGAYRGWEAFLPPQVELCAVQLPGREGRFREPLCRNLNVLLNAVQKELLSLSELDTVLVGYSVGAIVAYALALRLTAESIAPPVHLVPIACPTPAFLESRPLKSSLSEHDFLDRVLMLNAGSQEPVNQELLTLMIPAVKADIEIVESFDANQRSQVRCPISALGATSDPSVAPEHLNDWKSLTTGNFGVRYFPGNHFFLRECLQDAAAWLLPRLGC